MENKSRITKVKKNSEGDITDVMLSNGSICSVNEAITMVNDHMIEGVNVGKAKSGKEYLRSNPNDTKEDNLDSMPTF